MKYGRRLTAKHYKKVKKMRKKHRTVLKKFAKAKGTKVPFLKKIKIGR